MNNLEFSGIFICSILLVLFIVFVSENNTMKKLYSAIKEYGQGIAWLLTIIATTASFSYGAGYYFGKAKSDTESQKIIYNQQRTIDSLKLQLSGGIIYIPK